MNICFYCNFNGGGTERAAANLVRYLKNDYHVFMLNTDSLPPTYPVSGVAMDYVSGESLAKQIVQTARYLKKNKIDVLIALEALSGISAIPAAFLAHCKLVIWEHANYYQSQGSRHATRLRRLDLRLASAYVLLTARDRRNFEAHFKPNPRKLWQIYNIAALPNRAQYSAERRTIVSVGHINANKNFIIIPDIAKELFADHPDWRWKIYGAPGGAEYEKLKAKIKEYGLEDRVLLPGFSGNTDEIYGDAALYVMTSHFEGLPMVLLEAKSYGLPIVSFDIETGPDEIVDHGVNGFLAPHGDLNAITQMIRRLMDDDALRVRFSQNAPRGLEKFSGASIAAQWRELLNTL